MNRIVAWSVALALALTSHAGAATKKDSAKPQTVNVKAALTQAKRAIAYTLKDAESVRWRSAKIAPTGNVCIEVNAKNSYGAYTGFEPLVYNARTGGVLGADNFAWMWCNHFRMFPKGSVTVNAAQ